jgi:NAD-dependent dihydropyrimidine dehydrogenase PreA subunit
MCYAKSRKPNISASHHLEMVKFLPIDPDFQSKRKTVSEHNGHKVWNADELNKLGIHGTYAAVDWDVCVGDGVCISVCPVSLYDWAEAPGNQKRSDPAREKDCIQCLACETQCPTQAIKITAPP